MCFRLSGDLWVLSPESVREACKQDGRVGSARVAPIGWCREGFREDLNFYLVSCGNSLLRDPPVDLYAAARFLQEDVRKVAPNARGFVDRMTEKGSGGARNVVNEKNGRASGRERGGPYE